MALKILATGLIALTFQTAPSAASSPSGSEEEPWHDNRVPSPFKPGDNNRAQLAFSFDENLSVSPNPGFIDILDLMDNDSDFIAHQEDNKAEKMKRRFQKK